MNNFWLNRKGEEGAAPFRSGRFYCVGEYINDQLSFEKHLHENSGGFTLQGAC